MSVTDWHNMKKKEKEEFITLQTVLFFVTGTDRVPPTGFSPELTLTFLHEEKDTLATASTCACELRLPTAYANRNYTDFEERMVLSLKGSRGFGTL